MHSAFHSPVLGAATPSQGVSLFGVNSSAKASPSVTSALPSFHLTSSPQLQADRGGNCPEDDTVLSSAASTDFGNSSLLHDSQEAELDWFGLDLMSEEEQSNRARALLGSGEINMDAEDDLSSAPELHLLKVISRANSIQPQQQEKSILGDQTEENSAVIDLTVSSPSSIASLPLLQSPISNPIVPLFLPPSPSLFTLTPPIPALQRSQSESTFTSNQPMYTPSPRVTGSLSKFRSQEPVPLSTQIPSHVYESIAVITTLPPQPMNTTVLPQAPPVIKKAVLPYLEACSFSRIESMPSTPVPVGAQWKLLSSRPALSAHCMQHFEVLDEVKHQVLERTFFLASGLPGFSSNALSSSISSLFETFRVSIIQLYIRRAKAQAMMDDKARKAGIPVVKEEESPVHWALTIPPISDFRQSSSASTLDAIAEHQHVKAEGEIGAVETQEEDAEVARLLPQGDEDGRMEICQTPVKQAIVEESFVGRRPPPLVRRAQSVHVYRPPSASVCRRLTYDRSSSRCRTAMPSSSHTNRQLLSNAPLTEWFQANQSDPYPSPEEKERLCQATGLSMDQLAHWFINARMRQWSAQHHGSDENNFVLLLRSTTDSLILLSL